MPQNWKHIMMTLKNKDFKFSVILLILTGIFFLESCERKNNNMQNYKLKDKSIIEEGDSRNEFKPLIEAKYPELTDYSENDVQEKFNKEIMHYVSGMIDGFKLDIKENAASKDSAEIGVFFKIQYKVYTQTNHLISIAFTLESEWNGPHPTIDIQTFNFDLNSKKFIKLKDIIESNDSNLKLISISNDIIAKDWGDECKISSDIKELRNFNLTKDKLVLSFDIREIDRHCEIVTVEIPYADVRGLLKNESIISEISD